MPEKISLIRQIIKVLAVVSLLTSAVAVCLLVLAWLSLGPGSELRQLAGVDFLLSRGLVVAIISLLFGLAGLKTASGIMNGRRWSWPAALLLAILLLPLFPLGTIFGLKLLFDLFHREVREWFRHPESFREITSRTEPKALGVNIDLINQLEKKSRPGKG
ncbi:MAG: hypothetical protein ACUVRL_00970 [Candidatus Saccharicenans sp.]|uniref:hypothetical protein n=1 Tax=Candidatus Saccharicenans sp. TaxID=2819258 RepID=UPI004049A548